MATLTLTLDKASYNKGDTITATYALTGDVVPAVSAPVPVKGSAFVDGQTLSFDGTVTVTTPGTHAHTFNAPTINGVPMVATTNPLVWRGVA